MSPRLYPTNASKILGQYLKSQRKDLGLTQEEFGDRLGLSRQHVGNLERGDNEISINTLIKVADKLGTQASTILKNAGF